MRKPLTKKGWLAFKIIMGGVDVIQLLVDFIPVVGEVINEIADIIIGILLALIYWYKRAINLQAFIGLVFGFFGEEVTAAAAPLWWLDVWYTEKNAPPSLPEQGAAVAGSYMTQAMATVATQNQGGEGPLNQNVAGTPVRMPDAARQRPLNIKENGVSVRPPSAR